MRKDPTEFRERFLRWKKGELVYENGLTLPAYEDGKSPRKLEYHPEEDYYYGGKVFPGKELVVTGVNKKQRPYWVTAKTKQLQPSELMAPFGLVGEAINTIPVVGPAFNEYVGPVLAAGNWIAGKGNPYKGAELRALDERLLGAYLPFDFFIGPKVAGKISNPAFKSASNLTKRIYNESSPWVWNIPENKNMAYRIMGPLEKDWLLQGNELSTRATNALTKVEEAIARATEPKAGRFTLFKAGAEHGGRKLFAKGLPWKGTTTTHGEKQYLAIPGENLPWVSGRHYEGPQGYGFKVGDISFEEAPFGSHIDLQANAEGFTGINPSALEGSAIYSPMKIFGHKFGYRKQPIGPSKNTIGDNIISTFKDKMNYLQSKRLLGDPSISEQLYMSLMKDWLEDLTTFMTPFRKRASTGQTVGDVIDYNWGLYGGKDKLISELSENKRWSLLKTMENSEERPRMMKAIHMDETGSQPVNERGFVPKDNTNSNSTWYSGGEPEIWWNRGKMYYSPKQYRDAFLIPTTYVADINTLRSYGIKFPTDLINVLHTPGVVPYESIDFALRPNGLTGFFDKIKYLSQ